MTVGLFRNLNRRTTPLERSHCSFRLTHSPRFRLTANIRIFNSRNSIAGAAARSPLKTVHWTVFRAFRTPRVLRQQKKKALWPQYHLDNDIGKKAKRTDCQEKVVSSLYSERHQQNRHTKQTDAFICDEYVYNTVVRLLCRGSLLPTGI